MQLKWMPICCFRSSRKPSLELLVLPQTLLLAVAQKLPAASFVTFRRCCRTTNNFAEQNNALIAISIDMMHISIQQRRGELFLIYKIRHNGKTLPPMWEESSTSGWELSRYSGFSFCDIEVIDKTENSQVRKEAVAVINALLECCTRRCVRLHCEGLFETTDLKSRKLQIETE